MTPPSATPSPSPVRGADVTTFALGGPLRRFFDIRKPSDAREIIRDCDAEGQPWRVMGGGSNLLIADAGVEDVVVRLRRPGADIERIEDDVAVSAAMDLDELALRAVEEGLDGLLFATGIPGTVGGAVAGNAGAYGEQIADRIVTLSLYHPRRGPRVAPRDAVRFGYRWSSLSEDGEVVESVRLRLWRGDRNRLRAEREQLLAWRRERHPDWRALPTAGSFFRNIEPSSAAERRKSAGWFLERAGAKALRVGGAGVFEKHANIIVKRSTECRSEDVLELSRRMAAAVREAFGLSLRREVRLWGRFEQPEDVGSGDCDLSADSPV